VVALLLEFPLAQARRGYAVEARVLDAILPEYFGLAEIVHLTPSDDAGSTDGIESRTAVIDSFDAALTAIGRHDADRVLMLGGECSVSVAPFTALTRKYGDNLAVVWIDSHPDSDPPDTAYDDGATRWPTAHCSTSGRCPRPHPRTDAARGSHVRMS
jgi:arginase